MVAYDLMIGDYVLVNGVPRKVEAITKKKIGYHINPQKNRLHYARLRDVEPIKITEDFLKQNGCQEGANSVYRIFEGFHIAELRIVDRYRIKIKIYVDLPFDEDTEFEYVVFAHLHILQHVLKIIGINKTWKL